MTDISNLCMECLGTKNESGVCSRCGKEEDIIQTSPLLPIKSVIAQRYLIAKAHKQNSEGITYSAYDMALEKPVSVREFFPEKSAARDIDLINIIPKEGMSKVYLQHLSSFISLWKKIMRLKGVSSLITVNEVFECNGTAYAVYDESERLTLRDYLLNTTEGFITWEQARILFMPVLSTLGTLHTSGIVHKGINPDAFIFSKDGKLKLTDFCTDHVRINGGFTRAEIFDGYAPVEQYAVPAKTDARTDIYSFCCVLYRSLIGALPIDARERAQNDRMMIPARFAEQLPAYVINALINGMMIYPADRTDNIEQLRSDLSASQRAIGASAPDYTPEKAVTPPAKTSPFVNKLSETDKTEPVTKEQAKSQAQPPVGKEKKKQNTKNKKDNKADKKAAKKEKKKEKRARRRKNFKIAFLAIVLAVLLGLIGFLSLKIIDMTKQPEQTTGASSIITVPNFVGSKISDIIAKPEYTDYFIFNTIKEHHPTIMPGVVIEQNIPVNSTASKGDTIILTISAGPKSVEIPDVTGYSYTEAEKLLTAQGLICKKSLIHNDGTHPGNTVAETIPAKGEIITEGNEITIIVYTSLEEVTSGNNQQSNQPDNQQNTSGNAVQEFLESLSGNPVPAQ